MIHDVVRLTHMDARMRNLLVNTSKLWNKFTISGSESSHKLGGLFILRSGERTLYLLISLHWCLLQKEGFSSFVDYLLGVFGLPLLEHIEVDYEDEENLGFGGCISLPSNGANLRSISLTGVQIEPSHRLDLDNMTCIHLGAGKRWNWTNKSLISFFQAATSLQELHFVGGKGIFHTSTDDGPEVMPFNLPTLRRVRFLNTAPGLITSFLHRVDAPLLEEVELTTPTHRNQEKEVFAGWKAAAHITICNPLLALPVRTLKLRDAKVKCRTKELHYFILFLMVVFPHVTTLESKVLFTDILDICVWLADKQPLGIPLVWMRVGTSKVCRHFDHGMEEIYRKGVTYLTNSLRTLKEQGVMNLQELRLSVDLLLQPPVGRASVVALSELVGKLILDD